MKKLEIVDIQGCYQCPYFALAKLEVADWAGKAMISYCDRLVSTTPKTNAVETFAAVNRALVEYESIPDWCPLPDQ